jgi:pimeloyl-ACP methyl ester carboxylesterase
VTATAARVAPQERIAIQSESETLSADLYGRLPASRAVVLVHGQNWDASGWRDVGPLFAARGVPALALNLRGYGTSTGKTNRYRPGKPWTPVTDLHAAKSALRERGVKEIALVGSSMGGSAVLASSFEADIECVVAISAPVAAVPDELAKRITGRKLFVCADRDSLRATPNALRCFTEAAAPKKLVLFGGREHSRAMFVAPYGEDALGEIVGFVCRQG